MHHSKTSEPVRTIKVKSSPETTFNTRQLKTAIDNYLFAHQYSGFISNDTNDLNSIISSFADLVKDSAQEGTVPLPQSAL